MSRPASRLLDRLSRVVTPGRRLIPQIDGFRFVAISSVFFYHIATTIAGQGTSTTSPNLAIRFLMDVGRYGVELFFVISGFVLALPFVRARLAGGKPVSLRAYFLRRVTRLEPPYFFLMLAIFTVECASGAFLARDMWPHLIAGMVYQHNAIYGVMNPVLGATWSLEVEIQFYVLTPILTGIFLVRNHRLRRALLVALILDFGLSHYYATQFRYFGSVIGHLQEFFAGYLLADIYVVDWRERPTESRAWDGVAILCWIAIWPLVSYQRFFYPIEPLVILLAYCGSIRGRYCRRVFGNPWLVAIGGMCYTIYLVHGPIIVHALQLGLGRIGPMPFGHALLFWSVVLTPLTLAVSGILFVVLERPCMNPAWPSQLLTWVRSKARRHSGVV